MILTPEQQELLSAYLDGEVSAAEAALAKALLERSEARVYFDQLRAISERIREHGAAKAPADFKQGVLAHLEGDYDGVSRPTSNQRPVQQMPAIGWRMPLMAAAAAVIVAVGVLASGVMFRQDAPPPGVADVRQHQPGAASEVSQEPMRLKKDTDAPSHEGTPESRPQPAPPKEPEKSKGAEDKVRGTDGKDDRKTGHQSDAHEWAASISFEDAATEISVSCNRQTSITQLYTEILSASSLYGEANLRASRVNYSVASVGADFTSYQGVEISVEEARVPELLAALERLAVDHGMGQVVVPGHLRRSVASQLRYVDALQDVADALARGESPSPEDLAFENYKKASRAADPNARRADGILPPQAQREVVGRLGKAELGTEADSGSGSGGPTDEEVTRPASVVRLIIRLQ
jgi:negative regulator of sigma E activity